jgi:hypothetical protein
MPNAAEAVEVAGITLTHPDRVLWPKQGVTKRGVAEFYAGIADRLLPHMVNRPLTLVRCPSGSDGACFIQKHPWAGLHKAVRRVRRGGEDWLAIDLAIDDVTGLVALVQTGVSVLHGGGGKGGPSPHGWSGDADGVRTSEVEHAVEHRGGDGDLDSLRLIGMEAQRVADHLLPAPDLALDPGPLVVAAVPLPDHPSCLGDPLDVTVALSGSGVRRVGEHGIGTRRHDHRCIGMALVHGGVDAGAVVRILAKIT